MPRLIGVVNASPIYTLGLSGALAGRGFAFEAVTEPDKWLSQHESAALLIGVHDRSDLDVVIDLSQSDRHRAVMTVVSQSEPSLIKACLEAGAQGAISENATSEEVTIALEAAMIGRTVLPTEMVRELCRHVPEAALPVSDTEISMLRGLAAGETVSALAESHGYSEREVYRRLRHAYEALGVERRIEALLKLARAGLID